METDVQTDRIISEPVLCGNRCRISFVRSVCSVQVRCRCFNRGTVRSKSNEFADFTLKNSLNRSNCEISVISMRVTLVWKSDCPVPFPIIRWFVRRFVGFSFGPLFENIRTESGRFCPIVSGIDQNWRSHDFLFSGRKFNR